MTGELFEKILIPIDFSHCSREAFRFGLNLARVFQSQVLLRHVVDVNALDSLNALGLAKPSDEKSQKKITSPCPFPCAKASSNGRGQGIIRLPFFE